MHRTRAGRSGLALASPAAFLLTVLCLLLTAYSTLPPAHRLPLTSSDPVANFLSRWPHAAETPQTAAQLAKLFTRAKPGAVEEILQTLVALSKAHESATPGTYVR